MASDGHGFFAELKRRNVLRAAVLYVATVWALSQGISQLTPSLGLPDAATRWFLIACAVGFPFWVAAAWFYEFTPQGFRRDADIAHDAPVRKSNARRLDFAIIAVLAVAVVLLTAGYFIHPRTRAGVAAQPFDPPRDSLVVLPFADLGGNPSQRNFADGITEELTDALGQNTGLRVIAWDTASKYAGRVASASEVGRALNVANVVTGKVLRQGNVVRVIVELADATTGYQVWSHHYDDTLANVFQVQDQITAAIAEALKVKFANLGTARPVDPEAHDLALQAWALMQTGRSAAPFEQARTLLERAVALAPDYAEAHAGLARAWFDLTQNSTLPLAQALPKVRAEAGKALALDPGNVDALVVLGNAALVEGRVADARTHYERALQLDPSNAAAHLDYALVLPLKDALAQDLEAGALDPDNATLQNNLATTYLDLGQYARAVAPLEKLLKLAPHSVDATFELATAYALLGRHADAAKTFDAAQPETPAAKALVAAGGLAYRSVLDPKLKDQALAAADALRRQPGLDPDSQYNVVLLYLVLGRNATALDVLTANCAAAPAGCNDLGSNPTYLPLRADARFRALVAKYDTVTHPAGSVAAASAKP